MDDETMSERVMKLQMSPSEEVPGVVISTWLALDGRWAWSVDGVPESQKMVSRLLGRGHGFATRADARKMAETAAVAIARADRIMREEEDGQATS